MKIESVEFVRSAASAADLPRERLPELCMVGRSNVGKSTLINALVRKAVARTSATPGKTRLLNLYRIVTRPTGPFYLVDLPGYGYVRKKEAKDEFDRLAALYFARAAGSRPVRPEVRKSRLRSPGIEASYGEARRSVLAKAARSPEVGLDVRTPGQPDARTAGEASIGVLLAVDARHPGIESDLTTAAWLRSRGFAPLVVVTKLDKLPKRERAAALQQFEHLFGGAAPQSTPADGAFGNAVVGVSAETGEGIEDLWKRMASWIASAAQANSRPRSRP